MVCLGHELEKNIIKYHQIKCLQWKSASATSGVKAPSKPTEAQVKEQSVVRGGDAIMFTEKGGNDALTIGQAVNTIFGRGVLLDTGSSEHKCLSIKMKWGVIYAVSPSSIGIHVQNNGGMILLCLWT